MKFTSLSLLLALAAPSMAAPVTTAPPRYNWQNVTIGGGGYVTGVISHPTKDATFLRTDVGGFYRRDGEKWQAITDGFEASQSNYYGGEALAFDPQNPAVIYIAGGKYTAEWAGKGAIFRSANSGKTWKKLALELPMGGNQDRRYGGERLAVDPFDSKHLIFGSRAGELWKSRDTGTTWTRVALPQKGKADVGLLSLVFSTQKRGLIFANSFGAGISSSRDGGATWNILEGAPTNALRLTPLANGLLATAEGASPVENRARGGLWKWDGAMWSDITPPVDSSQAENGFCALAVRPTDEKTVVTATNQLESTLFSLSKDGGITWKTLQNQPQNSVPWQKTTLGKKAFASHVAALAFDGASDSVLFTDWYGVWKSAPLGDGSAPIEWKNEARGIEQTVVFDLLSAPGGAPLLSGLADVDGFLHTALREPPVAAYSQSGPWFQHTFDLAFCAQKPQNLARVGGNAWSNTYWGASSDDGGKTWREFGPKRDKPILRVAIGADDPLNLVTLNSKSPALFSRDGGTTWAQCVGLPDGPEGPWFWGRPLAADAVRAGVFYVAQGGSFYRSEDGGANFQKLGDLPDDGRGGLQVRPHVAGELWQSAGDRGLFRSLDGGKNWQKITGVESASLLAVGEVEGQFAVFFVGKVDGKYGLYRSLDKGENWQKIENGTGFLPGDEPNSIALSGNGDGAVFVGTNGRGVLVGKPAL